MTKLKELSRKFFFTLDDVVQQAGIQTASARVWCSRLVRRGELIRLKKGFYVASSKWENLSPQDLLKIANFLQVPSYISLMTALAHYEVTTQVQKGYYESVCLKRSITYNVQDSVFSYIKIQPRYYREFVKTDGFFIATQEKALLDMVYLYSYGKYRFDVASLNFEKLNMKKLKHLSETYPAKTKETLKRLCGI